ncbi:hypothetical protein C0995_012194 [Termitomyces sp. Mi166|nr:hypothetical protein C0995_016234 [Termitomyces sp. Mi166\
MLTILKALLKWEDKLMGYKIHIITDHKALEFFKTQGELNKVADCLSRYFESDTAEDMHNVYDYVQADKWIDPEGEDLPLHRFHKIVEKRVEIRAMQAQELCRSKRLKEQKELRDLEAQQMEKATKTPNKGIEFINLT